MQKKKDRVKRAQALYNQCRKMNRAEKEQRAKKENMSIDSLIRYIALGNPQAQPIRSAFLKDLIGWADAGVLAKLSGSKEENAKLILSWEVNEKTFQDTKSKYDEKKELILKGKML